jgi:DNA-binding LacI/PurR family transcriptional regulator
MPPPEVVPAVPCVYGDQEAGSYLAARHLVALGHRRIACTPKVLHSRRGDGVRRALREAGVSEEPVSLPPAADHPYHCDWEPLRPLLDRRVSPDAATALLAWSDEGAIRLLHTMRRHGLSVPEDLSVVAYDNVPAGEHSVPPLDTIDGHAEEQVRHALRLLSSPLEPGRVPTVAVTPTLVRRESVAPPPR